METLVSVDKESKVRPKDIDINPRLIRFPSIGMVSVEYEQIVYALIRFSKEAGRWLGFKYKSRLPEEDVFSKMVKMGLLEIKEEVDGYVYGLSVSCIDKIYVNQKSKK